MDNKKKKGFDNSVLRNFSLITQFGIYMIVPIAGLSALGIFLDRHFGTQWIVIAGFFIGAVAGANNVYRLAMKIVNKKSEEKPHNIINRRSDKPGDTDPAGDYDKFSEKQK